MKNNDLIFESLENILLHETNNKSWLYNPKHNKLYQNKLKELQETDKQIEFTDDCNDKNDRIYWKNIIIRTLRNLNLFMP